MGIDSVSYLAEQFIRPLKKKRPMQKSMNNQIEIEYVELLRTSKNDEESLNRLEKFYQKYAHSDPDKKILRKYLHQKGWILVNMGKYEEGLHVNKTLLSMLEKQDIELPMVIKKTAICYANLGEKSLAISLIEEEYFGNPDIRNEIVDLNLLQEVDRIMESEEFLLKYNELVTHIYSYMGAERGDHDLRTLVTHLYELNKKSNRKYSMLLIEVVQLYNVEDKIKKIKEYIDTESVGYYRDMAVNFLKHLDGNS